MFQLCTIQPVTEIMRPWCVCISQPVLASLQNLLPHSHPKSNTQILHMHVYQHAHQYHVHKHLCIQRDFHRVFKPAPPQHSQAPPTTLTHLVHFELAPPEHSHALPTALATKSTDNEIDIFICSTSNTSNSCKLVDDQHVEHQLRPMFVCSTSISILKAPIVVNHRRYHRNHEFHATTTPPKGYLSISQQQRG